MALAAATGEAALTPVHPPPQSRTVAVVGTGAVGGYYGARLWEAGHTVRFLLRGDGEICRARGLNVTSIHGNVFIPPEQLLAYSDTKDMGGAVDWVLVCVKSTSFESIPKLIAPLLDPERTRVLLIMNGLGLEESLVDAMGGDARFCRSLYGGMAFICSNRLQPGHMDHSYAGLLAVGRHSGSDTAAADRTALEQLWAPSKVDISFEPNLLRGRWKKMLWNLPFNGISVAMGGITVDHIVQTASLRRLAQTVMLEALTIANADLAVRGGHPEECLPFTQDDMDYMMSLSDGMEFAYKTSTMLDLTHRRAMEVRFLFQIPLERGQSLGISTPHLETIVAQIEGFQSIHRLY